MICFVWIIGQCLLYLMKKQGIAQSLSLYFGDITHHPVPEFYQTKPGARVMGNFSILCLFIGHAALIFAAAAKGS
jgi:hypothetical protein